MVKRRASPTAFSGVDNGRIESKACSLKSFKFEDIVSSHSLILTSDLLIPHTVTFIKQLHELLSKMILYLKSMINTAFYFHLNHPSPLSSHVASLQSCPSAASSPSLSLSCLTGLEKCIVGLWFSHHTCHCKDRWF